MNTKETPFEIYFSTENLKLAYYRVVCSPERLVKDRFGIHAFGSSLDDNLKYLSDKIISGKYYPQKAFKYYETKPSGTQRTKTLLMIEDSLVYQAIANIIASRSYDLLAEHDDFVFGSVLVPETKEGVELLNEENAKFFFFKFWKSLFVKFKDSVIKAIEKDKSSFKFETDITGFFDSIPHYNLLFTLSEHFNVEDDILDLLSTCLNVWSGTKESATPGVGIPQGPQASFLLANLLLYPLDKKLISSAFKYYRYMDDIKIYAYDEEELREVLVIIDNYLKGNGLSINAKKTGITKIDDSREDETARELKKFDIIGNDYTGEELLPSSLSEGGLNAEIIKDILNVSDQPSGKDINDISVSYVDTIENLDEIIAFWEKEITEVEIYLPELFEQEPLRLREDAEVDDIDFIRLSAKYGVALRNLLELKDVSISEHLIKYWVFALKKYFWRASNFILTLQYYGGNEALKSELISIYKSDKNYESYRYHIISCLTYNFEYSDRELREFHKYLKDEKSELARYAIYCLLIKHTNDNQFFATIRSQLKNESTYLKLIVLDYWKRDSKRVNTMDELVKSIGL